ncbi:MAG: pantoate--beta-alanine ligase [Xanthomonadaceae bacterium]|jgi:pantoate--beta-alanine ligase|nr:pantoate--beta-alanine ligase [Xanthomonadaceae bacterium]
MTENITELSQLRRLLEVWRRDGLRVGLVPTMGNLHAGHFSLVRQIRERVDRVVVSIFVNPTQFGAHEDFGCYPRTPEADVAGLVQQGCEAAWMPSIETMYPFGIEQAVRMHLPGISDILEGALRPGHFDGVCSVVTRLLHQVRPDVAAFGRKDYQQLAVIRRMVDDMAIPVEILAGDIVREDNGLAMSSRNQYLSAEERERATGIFHSLCGMRDAAMAGMDSTEVESAAQRSLHHAGFGIDYAALRKPDLTVPEAGESGPRVALIAARLGNTRLIDNLEFSIC